MSEIGGVGESGGLVNCVGEFTTCSFATGGDEVPGFAYNATSTRLYAACYGSGVYVTDLDPPREVCPYATRQLFHAGALGLVAPAAVAGKTRSRRLPYGAALLRVCR